MGYFRRPGKALIRLRICAGWSEPLLVAHTTLMEISCRGSLICTIKFQESLTVLITYIHWRTGDKIDSHAKNKKYRIICVSKTNTLTICAATAQLICVFFTAYAKNKQFFMKQLILFDSFFPDYAKRLDKRSERV